MALSYLVDAAKRNTPYIKAAEPNSPLKKLVDLPSKEGQKSDAKAEEAMQFLKAKVNWENCKFRKTVGTRDTCEQFLILCRKDKCNNKFITPRDSE